MKSAPTRHGTTIKFTSAKPRGNARARARTQDLVQIFHQNVTGVEINANLGEDVEDDGEAGEVDANAIAAETLLHVFR